MGLSISLASWQQFIDKVFGIPKERKIQVLIKFGLNIFPYNVKSLQDGMMIENLLIHQQEE